MLKHDSNLKNNLSLEHDYSMKKNTKHAMPMEYVYVCVYLVSAKGRAKNELKTSNCSQTPPLPPKV